jgi:hypothetical protein
VVSTTAMGAEGTTTSYWSDRISAPLRPMVTTTVPTPRCRN